jgi:alkanesulfonate monooxygenase SsuD/methylene tetrahydromethanopterin reductase-like flavin-dependent oxidoreductase (luciferase family)
VIQARLGRLNPGPVRGHLPLMIGGSGERVTLRLVAQYADLWNGFGDPAGARRLNGVLDGWCARVERDPAAIERSITIGPWQVPLADQYLAAGVTHLIIGADGSAASLRPLADLVAWRDARQAGRSLPPALGSRMAAGRLLWTGVRLARGAARRLRRLGR